jgi:pre-mRNA-splicing factor CWC22
LCLDFSLFFSRYLNDHL